jgi:predicted transcriptional regulator
MKPPAPLNYVRSFECAARHLSFTAAAKELGYTQAAVSTHVRALEHYIGRQLFIRYPRSLKLTEMGEAFLPTLRQALDLIDQATEAVVTSSRKRTVVVSWASIWPTTTRACRPTRPISRSNWRPWGPALLRPSARSHGFFCSAACLSNRFRFARQVHGIITLRRPNSRRAMWYARCGSGFSPERRSIVPGRPWP